ncbi:MAG: hypothetical protein JWO38_8138 [Gemmataceae bacterium]|nr:hypothetical protein [Gemmataceae bacterium]
MFVAIHSVRCTRAVRAIPQDTLPIRPAVQPPARYRDG